MNVALHDNLLLFLGFLGAIILFLFQFHKVQGCSSLTCYSSCTNFYFLTGGTAVAKSFLQSAFGKLLHLILGDACCYCNLFNSVIKENGNPWFCSIQQIYEVGSWTDNDVPLIQWSIILLGSAFSHNGCSKYSFLPPQTRACTGIAPSPHSLSPMFWFHCAWRILNTL